MQALDWPRKWVTVWGHTGYDEASHEPLDDAALQVRILDVCAQVCIALAAVFLSGMMVLTVIDVALRKLIGYPLRGTFEIIELGLACTIFFALPAVFIRRQNLVVDFLDRLISPSATSILDWLGTALSAAVLFVMLWQMALLAEDMHAMGDITADLAIAKLWYWIPLLAGVGASALVSLVFVIRVGRQR